MKTHNLSQSEQAQILTNAILHFIETDSMNDSFIKAMSSLTYHYRKIGEQLAELFFHWEAQSVKQAQSPFLEESQSNPLSETITIVLFDDSPTRLRLLEKHLNQQRDMQVLASFESAGRAVEVCQQWLPDLVIMDMQMPKVDGIAATKRMVQHFGETIPVVLITEQIVFYEVLQAMTAGAKGILSKTDGILKLDSRLRSVYRGDFLVSQAIRDVFLRYMGYRFILTNTQMEVFGKILEGKSREQMESQLHMTKEAVRQTIYRIRNIIGVKGTEAEIRDYFFNRPTK